MQTRSLVTTLLISLFVLPLLSCSRIPAATPASSVKTATTSNTGFMGMRSGIFKSKTESLPAALPLRKISNSSGTCPTPNLRAALARSKQASLKK